MGVWRVFSTPLGTGHWGLATLTGSTKLKSTVRDVLDSPDFRNLVMRRWRVSIVLSTLLFVVYYGYILLIAMAPRLVSRRVGPATTVGILMAAAVIGGAWILTAIYVVWANRHYDPDVARLRARMQGD